MSKYYPGDDMARAAFGVMTRRGWWSVPRLADGSEWIAMNAFCVQIERGGNTGTYFISADPFTCLVEADAWLAAQEKRKRQP